MPRLSNKERITTDLSWSKSSGMPEVVAAAKGSASCKAAKQSLTKVTKKPPKKQRKSACVYRRITSEASHFVHYNKRHTISAKEIQSAVCLILPEELAKHAVSEGTKVVTK
ncbi:histone H2B-like [Carcharodon carcharias]|uniref:histone H2B-like n=1 Tax=Carcharodon carcharias TaxID=13397 RepID=UPI001B7E9901|nr:histone H2B-like [Carcharodon carcharias]